MLFISCERWRRTVKRRVILEPTALSSVTKLTDTYKNGSLENEVIYKRKLINNYICNNGVKQTHIEGPKISICTNVNVKFSNKK